MPIAQGDCRNPEAGFMPRGTPAKRKTPAPFEGGLIFLLDSYWKLWIGSGDGMQRPRVGLAVVGLAEARRGEVAVDGGLADGEAAFLGQDAMDGRAREPLAVQLDDQGMVGAEDAMTTPIFGRRGNLSRFDLGENFQPLLRIRDSSDDDALAHD